ncbi:hypothetical protein PO909_028422 [Leuciscus waleckii]
MLRSDELMLDNTLIPAYQERVTSLTFTTEHTNEHDDDELLLMTGTGRRAEKHERICILTIDSNTESVYDLCPDLIISRVCGSGICDGQRSSLMIQPQSVSESPIRTIMC